jgi:hypothetical protein
VARRGQARFVQQSGSDVRNKSSAELSGPQIGAYRAAGGPPEDSIGWPGGAVRSATRANLRTGQGLSDAATRSGFYGFRPSRRNCSRRAYVRANVSRGKSAQRQFNTSPGAHFITSLPREY